ncbi:helix-turn-helix transcriptional regulator [Sinorhizobium sp. FG01]|uniref:Helix-turn-helix transcriptional regulator n=2 Tax=Sinorhizobium TaxID=28105 RepID=A0A2S3YS75_9HYPH|nr:LuxR family transcriptional regulator protein [Sinorhizobium fredii]PDT43490.1 helix-turn-helix transcriptional regulator [Sinorhizobium sp. FG01]POH34489.1 helix-turn-helix transcriptional regulator [Sinorhizobium americanum]
MYILSATVGRTVTNSRATFQVPLDRQSPPGLTDPDVTDHPEDADYILLIDPRALDRECLAKSLLDYDPTLSIVTVGSFDEWRARKLHADPSAVLLIVGGSKIGEQEVCEKIENLAEKFKFSPVIVVAETDELGQILKALECGARGYIPSNVGINVAAEAIALARAGGVFVPASSILTMRETINSAVNGARCSDTFFTPREIEVAEALQRGKPNKIIAYEMDLCESTVKVHIRNIMKKLNATNRTEVAYKIREFMK